MSNLVAGQPSAVENQESLQYLTFTVVGELMAIGILDVKEIIEVGSMTRIPMTRDCIRGVINLRGNVVPVIDLRSRLADEISELSKRSCIVLVQVKVEEEYQTMGMLVDMVNEILDIPENDLQKAPDFGTDIDNEFIEKMARYNDEFIILLNIARVFSIDDLSGVDSQQRLTLENLA